MGGRTPIGEDSLPSYTLFNASLQWQIADPHRLIMGIRNISGTNLLDKPDIFGYAERGRSYDG